MTMQQKGRRKQKKKRNETCETIISQFYSLSVFHIDERPRLGGGVKWVMMPNEVHK